jgi:hypothetical protein
MSIDNGLIDLRVYTIRLRKMSKFLQVFDELAMPVQIKYLGLPIGMYTSVVGKLNQVVHLWAFPDMGSFEARHAARDLDPAWPAYLEASEDLIVAQETRLLRRVMQGSFASLPQIPASATAPRSAGW